MLSVACCVDLDLRVVPDTLLAPQNVGVYPLIVKLTATIIIKKQFPTNTKCMFLSPVRHVDNVV